MSVSLKFLGGVGTVTGSKYLVESGPDGRARVLVDCGLFQGLKKLRLRNWAPPPVDPKTINTVVLTHAHIDHSGYLPLLIKKGFSGPVFSSSATRDLCGILLPDSGHLHEKDAEYANRHGFSKHSPALPLYTQKDGEAAIARFRPTPFGEQSDLGAGFKARFFPAGHILGASIVEMMVGGTKIVFSGDLGRSNDATMVDPTPMTHADYLVVESTYGARRHDTQDPEAALAGIINRTVGRGGTVIVPAFAVGRAQSLMFHITELKAQKKIPRDLPVYLDSPMAINASEIFCAHGGEHRLSPAQCEAMGKTVQYVREAEQSKALVFDPVPKVLISASGMATGGRVVHHLKRYVSDHRNTILFTGFQAMGTRGEAMVNGADTIKIHGQYYPVRAEVQNLQMLSAHADADGIMAWLRNFSHPPKMTFITHGEPAASAALHQRIEQELGWPCKTPKDGDRVAL